MKFWKRYFLFLLVSYCFLGPNFTSAKEPPTKTVVASFYPMYIMAINVAQNVPGVNVVNLTPPVTGCLHDYSLTTQDMKTLSTADLFVANGGGMESFLDKVLMQYPNMKVVTLLAGLPLLEEQGKPNPHVWVSVRLAIREVHNLCESMKEFDPVHAELYQKNTEVYISKLEELTQRMKAKLDPFQGQKIVTFHEAFPYFAEEFGLDIVAVIEREPGSSPSAQELADTIDLIKKNQIKVLFAEPQYPSLSAQTIARETGAKILVLDPAVTGDLDPDAYLKIMEKNLSVLTQGLSL